MYAHGGNLHDYGLSLKDGMFFGESYGCLAFWSTPWPWLNKKFPLLAKLSQIKRMQQYNDCQEGMFGNWWRRKFMAETKLEKTNACTLLCRYTYWASEGRGHGGPLIGIISIYFLWVNLLHLFIPRNVWTKFDWDTKNAWTNAENIHIGQLAIFS